MSCGDANLEVGVGCVQDLLSGKLSKVDRVIYHERQDRILFENSSQRTVGKSLEDTSRRRNAAIVNPQTLNRQRVSNNHMG